MKDLRSALSDLRHSILQISTSNNLKMTEQHIEELKEYINDVFMWLHGKEKPTKIEYIDKLKQLKAAAATEEQP